MRCLVTGAAGFIGGYLIEELLRRGATVVASGRRPITDRLAGRPDLTTVPGDVLDGDFIRGLVGAAKADVVFHLAAQSLPVVSWERPAETFQVNVIGTLNVLQAARRSEGGVMVVLCGSSAEYGPGRDETPIAEDDPLVPSSPYGISKLAQDHLGRLYGEAYGLRVIRARPFFLIGPRKRRDVCSDMARHIVAIEQGRAGDLPVGNLDVVRDLLDVRDGVSALCTMAERGRAGEAYNIASGRGQRLRAVLDMMKTRARVAVVERLDPTKLRPVDEPVKIGDPAKLEALGWKPGFALEETLTDILEYWRSRDGSE
jgi:GDP-4-dehydro-6-deoxy-D-mannose reductase